VIATSIQTNGENELRGGRESRALGLFGERIKHDERHYSLPVGKQSRNPLSCHVEFDGGELPWRQLGQPFCPFGSMDIDIDVGWGKLLLRRGMACSYYTVRTKVERTALYVAIFSNRGTVGDGGSVWHMA
jgi:hypothetical protein